MPVPVAVLSSARWSSFQLSKQFIATALAAAGNPVLYVDPPISPLSLVRDRTRRADLRSPADETPSPHLRVWRPRVVPGQNSSIGQRVNAALLRRGVLARLQPGLVVGFALEARTVFAQLPGAHVYYCTDSAEDLPGTDADATRRRELRMARSADVVVACSRPLVEQLEGRGVAALYQPHGCDAGAFSGPFEPPRELDGLPRPLVGYVGSFNFRLDPALLGAALDAAAGGTLVLIGGGFGPAAGPEVTALTARQGVVALGHRDAASLPTLMAALDVGVVPYRRHPFNRKSFPIKILQHLASGTPVVSTPNGATDELGGAVTCVDSTEEFRLAVVAALEEPRSGEAAARRREEAAQRPWSAVAARLIESAGGPDIR